MPNDAAAEAARGVPAAQRGRGLGAEIGLARHDSPNAGVNTSPSRRSWSDDMPHTLAALGVRGALRVARAALIVTEAMGAEPSRSARSGRRTVRPPGRVGRAGGTRRSPTGPVRSPTAWTPALPPTAAARAPTGRTVTIRPARDGMGHVTAYLPMPHALAVHGALKTAADTSSENLPRGQVMADTLVERVTGRPGAVPVPIAVNVVINDRDTVGRGDDARTRARLRCRSPHRSRDVSWGTIWDDRSKATLRRLYQHPTSGALVAIGIPRPIASPRDSRRSSIYATTPAAPLLRRTDPPPRPRHPQPPRRTHQRHQRPRAVRSVQLHQGSPRLAGQRDGRRKRHPHRRIRHTHRRTTRIQRPTRHRRHRHHQRAASKDNSASTSPTTRPGRPADARLKDRSAA